MPKIKFSKTELKHQRDDLERFQRFLPTLQLKKQQLQMEVMRLRDEIKAHRQKAHDFRKSIKDWISLFSVPEVDTVFQQVEIGQIEIETRNIAGVDIPVLQDVHFSAPDYSLFAASAWVDSGVEAFQELIRLEIGERILRRQRELLEAELRTTTQRVNLFEKVKIPEAQENIRKIKIFLGDQETAAVARAKIAKTKIVQSGEA